MSEHHHTLYGLVIASNMALPALPEVPPTAADLQVRLGTGPPSGSRERLRWQRNIGAEGALHIYESDDGWTWRYPDDTTFWISADTATVHARWPDHFGLADAAAYLYGPITGFILRRRGVTSLHASVVRLPTKRAVAFCGPGGCGKSTLAAAAVAHGAALVTEDCAPVDGTSPPRIRRGYPKIRLWSDSAEALGVPAVPITDQWDKLHADAGAGFPTEPTALSAIYLPQRGATQLTISREPPASATMALLSNVYVDYVLGPEDRAHDLEVMASVVEAIPVYTLELPSDLRRIGAALDAVFEHSRGA